MAYGTVVRFKIEHSCGRETLVNTSSVVVLSDEVVLVVDVVVVVVLLLMMVMVMLLHTLLDVDCCDLDAYPSMSTSSVNINHEAHRSERGIMCANAAAFVHSCDNTL